MRAGWLVNFYALRAATMRGKRHVLAFAKSGQHYTPVAVAKQLTAGRDALGLPLVYVPRELGPHDIPRLIAANVPYVLPKRSLFLPEAGLSVTRAPETPVLRETFSAPAQLLVLGYILRKWDGAMTLSDGMERSAFSSASVVHAFQEIVHFGAGERLRGSDGRTVQIRLEPAREILERQGYRLEVSDKRYSGVPLDVSFNGELRGGVPWHCSRDIYRSRRRGTLPICPRSLGDGDAQGRIPSPHHDALRT